MSTPPTYGPAASGGTDPQPSRASGYTPPDAGAAQPARRAAEGYTPPEVGAAPRRASAPQPGGPAPAATPAPPTAPATTARSAAPTPSEAPAAPTRPAPSDAAGDPAPRPGTGVGPLLVKVVVALVALALVGLAVAWFTGMFAARPPSLPARVGGYTLDSGSQKRSDSFVDSATYRAAPGDVYVANLVRTGNEPRALFDAASAETRLQVGDVYCTGVNAKGNGGACRLTLPSGLVLVVESSTRHTAQETAAFATQVGAGVQ